MKIVCSKCQEKKLHKLFSKTQRRNKATKKPVCKKCTGHMDDFKSLYPTTILVPQPLNPQTSGLTVLTRLRENTPDNEENTQPVVFQMLEKVLSSPAQSPVESKPFLMTVGSFRCCVCDAVKQKRYITISHRYAICDQCSTDQVQQAFEIEGRSNVVRN
jgi:hypothetical protein